MKPKTSTGQNSAKEVEAGNANAAQKLLRVEFRNEAVTALERFGEITSRTPIEIVSDALRTYEWILREQTAEHKVVALGSEPASQTEIVNLVVNQPKAKAYFLPSARQP
jgi:hypothetical protein